MRPDTLGCTMNELVLPNPNATLLTTISAITLSSILLAGCVTDDAYARRLCLDKGIAESGAAYGDCITEQKAWIEEDRRHNVRFRPND